MMNNSMMMNGGMEMNPLWMLIFAVLIIVPFWIIFGKAGFSKWLSLLMVVPLVNIAMLYFLAFASWPSKIKDKQ